MRGLGQKNSRIACARYRGERKGNLKVGQVWGDVRQVWDLESERGLGRQPR